MPDETPAEEILRTARFRRAEGGAAPPEAETQVIVFRVGERELGVPIESVERTERMPPISLVPRCPAFLRGVASLRGGVVAVVDLAVLLGSRDEDAPPAPARSLIVLDCQGRRLGIQSESLPDFVRVKGSERLAVPQANPDVYSAVIERHFDPVGLLDPMKLFDLVQRRLAPDGDATRGDPDDE